MASSIPASAAPDAAVVLEPAAPQAGVLRRRGRALALGGAGFVLALAVTAILSPWMDEAAVLFGATAVAYLLAVLGFSITAGRVAGLRGAAALALAFPVMHFSYGLGFLRRVMQLALAPGRRARHAELPLSR